MSVPTENASTSLPASDLNDDSAKDGDSKDVAVKRSPRKVVALIVCSLIPFWLVPASHLWSSPDTATGFFHYELPYYVANGRSAFERGNGVMYPNPYDPSAEAPSIYFHWLPWTLGLLTAQLGLNPGMVTLAMTFLASLAFAWSTYRLVAYRVESQRNHSTAFLLAMWGGGCLAIFGTAVSLWSGRPWLESVLQFDPENGFWFLNWGRNAVFPTEAVYHTLVAFCWLAEIRRKVISANIWLLLLATTHPWSGLELLLTINLWRALQFARSVLIGRSAEQTLDNPENHRATKSHAFAFARNQLALSVTALVVFLGYYKVWLPSFSQHAQLEGVWELNWSVNSMTALLAYSLVLGFAATTLIRFKKWTRGEEFLLCALVVATGLAFHDRLIKPVQPIHFTRGYVWMPLFLLGLPAILKWLDGQRHSASKLSWVAVTLLLVFVLDNASFAIVHTNRQYHQQDGFHLGPSERAILAALDSTESVRGQVVMSDSESMNYLLPTFAEVRPWLGHLFNTPSFRDRKAIWKQCFEGDQVQIRSIPPDVSIVVIRQTRDQSGLVADPNWKRIRIENPEWSVWQRSK